MRDFDIHREILSELDWSHDVHSTELGVQVCNGIVTLSGTISSPLKKDLAIEAAHRVEGVRAVINTMTVHLVAFDGPSELDIARDALAALEQLGREAVDNIRLTVHRGSVTVSGQVRSRPARVDAERYLRAVRGVTDVINGINVIDADVDTTSIHASIENSFQRMAEQAARRISIEVDGPVLVLKGTVDTWAERDEAERAAMAAGATRIDNQIQVYPHIHTHADETVYIAG
jgi:osmotically-inducible protein OsmY